MVDAKFTPGPWSTDPDAEHMDVIGPCGIMIADCGMVDSNADTCRTNAALIAAAPDLYEALSTLDRIERGLQGWHEDAKLEAWAKARTALAKARGDAQ